MQRPDINIILCEEYSDQLDTIEERSEECTPQYELVRQFAREWTRQFSNEIASIIEDNCEFQQNIDEIKISFKEINEELEGNRLSSQKILKMILKLQSELEILKNLLDQSKSEMECAELETTLLMKRIKDLEDIMQKKSSESTHKCIIS